MPTDCYKQMWNFRVGPDCNQPPCGRGIMFFAGVRRSVSLFILPLRFVCTVVLYGLWRIIRLWKHLFIWNPDSLQTNKLPYKAHLNVTLHDQSLSLQHAAWKLALGLVASLVLVACLSVEEISLTANGVKFLTVLSATLSSSDSSLTARVTHEITWTSLRVLSGRQLHFMSFRLWYLNCDILNLKCITRARQ